MASDTMKPIDDECARLGAHFERLRKAAGFGLRTLAAEIGINFQTIRRHEAGNMMLRTNDLRRAAKAMGLPPGDLVELEDEQYDRRTHCRESRRSADGAHHGSSQ